MAEVERAPRVPVSERTSATPEFDQPGGLPGLASALGNRGFGQLVSRMDSGEGILAGGLVHPDVEQAIALAQGAGQHLEGTVARRLEPAMGGPVNDVRVHTGAQADALARAVSARAFTVGSDIFFSSGEYRPGTSDGDQLIAHEVAHVVQQRGAPVAGPLTVSQPGDALEREAEALARDLPG